MKAVLQRVKSAAVTADGAPSGACGAGLLILLGVARNDTESDALLLAEKIAKLRIFSDQNGKMNLSCTDVDGEALVVSNFTLNANYRKGNRPDYFDGASPEEAKRLYEYFISLLRARLRRVESGVFGADMQITTVCDGPVTICMDSEYLRKGKQK
jgi:D-tyrosyl-tRNA(Tyr) deacylase